LLFDARCEDVMRAYLLTAQILMGTSREGLILRGHNCIRNGVVVERIHMLLELEVNGAFIHALIVLE